MADPVTLTRRELDIMAIVWRRKSVVVSDVLEDLDEGLAYPTVLTMLRILEQKGYVRHERDGRSFRYYPLIQPDDAGDGVLQRLLSKVYRGSRELLVSRLIDTDDVSPEELRSMRRMLQKRLKEVE